MDERFPPGDVTPVPDSLASLIPVHVVEDLASLLGCPKEAVLSAITSSGVDYEKAVAMLRAAAPTYVAVKGRFETRRRGDVQGAFCYVAEGITGEAKDLTFWVGAGGLPESFDVYAGWESVRAAIRSIPASPDRSLYKQMESLLERLFPPTAINSLFRDPSSAPAKAHSLKEALSQSLKLDVSCTLEVERFHRIRLDMSSLGRRDEVPEPKQQKEDTKSKPSELTLACKPYLDPVKGLSVGELNVGAVVPVDLDDSGPLGRLIGRFLARAGRNAEFPVESVERSPAGDAVVKLAVSDGISAVFKMSRDMKIRVSPTSRPEPMSAPRGGPLALFLGALGLFLLVLILLLKR
jgi:hypothetical protein